jgi:hypothetical protein
MADAAAGRRERTSASGYEPRRGRLAPLGVFYPRVARAILLSVSLIGTTLGAGTLGYHAIAGLSWLKSFHQASMLLSGMGPVHTDFEATAAIVFDSLYAIFCGVMLLAATAVMFAPVFHRLLHRFHIEEEDAGRR